mmetsp:Transcript_99870/g.285499  ORF Transcript_99870/g.285499 Transcript_99870/m.285499 type:complete len:476 (-) Transcript_99870:2608-4035(-)
MYHHWLVVVLHGLLVLVSDSEDIAAHDRLLPRELHLHLEGLVVDHHLRDDHEGEEHVLDRVEYPHLARLVFSPAPIEHKDDEHGVGHDRHDDHEREDRLPHADVSRLLWDGPSYVVDNLVRVDSRLQNLANPSDDGRPRGGDDEEHRVAELLGKLVVILDRVVDHVVLLPLPLDLRVARLDLVLLLGLIEQLLLHLEGKRLERRAHLGEHDNEESLYHHPHALDPDAREPSRLVHILVDMLLQKGQVVQTGVRVDYGEAEGLRDEGVLVFSVRPVVLAIVEPARDLLVHDLHHGDLAGVHHGADEFTVSKANAGPVCRDEDHPDVKAREDEPEHRDEEGSRHDERELRARRLRTRAFQEATVVYFRVVAFNLVVVGEVAPLLTSRLPIPKVLTEELGPIDFLLLERGGAPAAREDVFGALPVLEHHHRPNIHDDRKAKEAWAYEGRAARFGVVEAHLGVLLVAGGARTNELERMA